MVKEVVHDEDEGDHSVTSESSQVERSKSGKQRNFFHDKIRFTTLILLLGAAVSGAFIALGVVNAKHSSEQDFKKRASDIVFQVKASWNDYVLFTKWVRESCQKPFVRDHNVIMGEDPSHAFGYCTYEEFDKIYEYVLSEGLTFQALQYVPNVTDAQRPYIEAYANKYFDKYYPGQVSNREFMQFVPDPAPGQPPFEPSDHRPFYFPLLHMLPVKGNEAAMLFDVYSRGSSKPSYDKATSTWKPVLGPRIKLIQETDPSAYSIILHQPGMLTSHENYTTHSVAVTQLIVRIPDLLIQFTKGMKSKEILYLYDSTSDVPLYLGAGEIVEENGNRSLVRIPEVELADIARPSHSQYYATDIDVADRIWTVAIVSTDQNPNFIISTVGGVIIFLACALIAIWYFRHLTVLEEMTGTQSLLSSMFPKEVQDRLLKDAMDAAAERTNEKDAFKNHKAADLQDFMGKDGLRDIVQLPTTRPIADLVLESSVMFADIAGFTAWSSTREPFQVFTLLETVFHTFDAIAKRRRVFKVETVGDCYVAVTGLPEPRKDHAVALVRFAKDCLNRFQVLTRRLEIELGPDTAELGVRIGIHSGPVTSGVLRGERPRFQLFGDTMNTASRIESAGKKNRIHVSKETAELLDEAGKKHWITKRKDIVFAKGKGELETFWVDARSDDNKSVNSKSSANSSSDLDHIAKDQDSHVKHTRLVDWNTSVLLKLLKGIVSRRKAGTMKADSDNDLTALEKQSRPPNTTVFDETVEVIELPVFDAKAAAKEENPDKVDLSDCVVQQLTKYIQTVAGFYRNNDFHNYEHATHVIMSTVKLLSRIIAPKEVIENGKDDAASLHDHTYGITSDYLTQFAAVFSALIHDMDHPGVPNITLINENDPLAKVYKNTSIAEQNSFDLAWEILMSDEYKELRRTIYTNKTEYRRFRQLVVNSVMATDVMDKQIGADRKVRWAKAFATDEQALQEPEHIAKNRKATIVLEHLIQASDVAHTMQHWHIYRKWNQRLFCELYSGYKNGRSDKNPADFWYEGEKGFLDFYVIPLAKKLKKCGVFGVSSDEFLNYATQNRREWETRGQQIVEEMVATLEKQPIQKQVISDTESSAVEIGSAEFEV